MTLTGSHRPRTYHRAKFIGPHGQVSALCFEIPHAIDLTKRQTWTLRDEAVTCTRCLAVIKARSAA